MSTRNRPRSRSRKQQDVPVWVDTESAGHERKVPMTPEGLDNTNNNSNNNSANWYAKQFPVVVAAKEWEVGRSRASILPSKKKLGRVRIEIRRKSDQPLGLQGYHDLEEGSVVSDWAGLIIDGDVLVFNILKQDTDGVSGSSSNGNGNGNGNSNAAASSMHSSLISNGRHHHQQQQQQNQNKRQHLSQSHRPLSSGSMSTLGFKGVDDRLLLTKVDPFIEENMKWSNKHSSPISKVSIKRDNARCTASLGSIYRNGSKEDVILYFFSEPEAISFIKFVKDVKKIHTTVAKDAMKRVAEETTRSIGNSSYANTNASVDYLIEIISATDLKAANQSTSDPFVVVYYGGDKVHKTEAVMKNLDPIWTIETKSMFIFTLHPEEYYNSELLFEVRDYETYTSGLNLGQALLSNNQLMKVNGERIELVLQNFHMGTYTQGHLAIRCKRATNSDIEFLKTPYKEGLTVRKNQNTYIKPLYSKQDPFLQFDKSKLINDKKHYFVRPMMYPTSSSTSAGSSSSTTTNDRRWMTREQMDEASKEESLNWTEAGSGTLGEVFVEIISCDDLPNLDSGLPSNKTDAFATLVCEDAIVTTDVIRDTLNPRFMPWTRRAFKFGIQHVSSLLFIGIFDHDKGKGNDHDPVGRIAIPLQKFTPGTVYNLSYDIYDSAQVVKRRSHGTINLRLSVKWQNQRGLFIDSISSNDNEQLFTINIDSKRNYKHAQYTIQGYADQKEYNLKTLLGYIDELYQLQSLFFTIKDALKTLFLWRGHYEVNICFCIKFKLPIHSMIMLTFGIVLTEFPNYSLSIFFASIAWFMLALLGHRRKRPSKWNRPSRYINLLFRFLTGVCYPEKIVPNEMMEEELNYIEKEMARSSNNERATEEFWNRLSDDLYELDEMKNNILYGDSINKTMKLEVFKNQLFPIQATLAGIVNQVRLIGSILNWDQMYISFWITTIAILLCIASSLDVYKNLHIFLWVKRFVFYVLLGPWIKVIDICYIQKFERLTDSEKVGQEKHRKRDKKNLFRKANIKKQMAKEELLKSVAMRQHLFGHHILAVPDLLTPERFPSVPRFESFATPASSDPSKSIRDAPKRAVIVGQQVTGTFVPTNYEDHMRKSTIIVPSEFTSLITDSEKYGSTNL